MQPVRTVERLLERRRLAENCLQEPARLGNHLLRRVVCTKRFDVPGSFDESVVRDTRHRGVAAAPVDADEERRRHLFGGRAEVDGAAAEDEPIPSSLVDGVVAANRVRMSLDEPAEPEPVSLLLVGHGHEDHVAGREEAVTLKRREGDRRSRHLSLHVESAPPPDLPVHEVSGPRVTIPLRGVGENSVGVTQERQRRTASARDPRNDVGPVGHAGDELALDTVLREIVAQELRGKRLVPGRVDGVDAD